MCSLLGQQSGKRPLSRGSGLPGLQTEKEQENLRRAKQCKNPEGNAHKPEIQSLGASHYSYHLYWNRWECFSCAKKKKSYCAWKVEPMSAEYECEKERERMTDWGKDCQRERTTEGQYEWHTGGIMKSSLPIRSKTRTVPVLSAYAKRAQSWLHATLRQWGFGSLGTAEGKRTKHWIWKLLFKILGSVWFMSVFLKEGSFAHQQIYFRWMKIN